MGSRSNRPPQKMRPRIFLKFPCQQPDRKWPRSGRKNCPTTLARRPQGRREQKHKKEKTRATMFHRPPIKLAQCSISLHASALAALSRRLQAARKTCASAAQSGARTGLISRESPLQGRAYTLQAMARSGKPRHPKGSGDLPVAAKASRAIFSVAPKKLLTLFRIIRNAMQ